MIPSLSLRRSARGCGPTTPPSQTGRARTWLLSLVGALIVFLPPRRRPEHVARAVRSRNPTAQDAQPRNRQSPDFWETFGHVMRKPPCERKPWKERVATFSARDQLLKIFILPHTEGRVERGP